MSPLLGPRNRVRQARAIRKIGRDWSCPPQIRVIASRSDVRPFDVVFCCWADVDYRSEIFDEYTRRQYVAKAPHRNPYGTEETPNKFAEFDIVTKLRVLFQLSQWTLMNPDRIRERMPEAKDTEQIQWVCGFDT